MTAAERARRSRREQGLPEVVADPAVYARLGRLLAAAASGTGARRDAA